MTAGGSSSPSGLSPEKTKQLWQKIDPETKADTLPEPYATMYEVIDDILQEVDDKIFRTYTSFSNATVS